MRHRSENRNRRILGPARSLKSSAGGIEAIADSVLERWFTAAFRARGPRELAGMRAMLTRTPKQGYLAACGALKRADLRPYAGRIEAPTLCLVGDEDGSTPVALVKETAALIPASRFEVIEGAGHLPNVEKPKIVAGLVAEHARRAASCRATQAAREIGGAKTGCRELMVRETSALPVHGMREYRHPPFLRPGGSRRPRGPLYACPNPFRRTPSRRQSMAPRAT